MRSKYGAKKVMIDGIKFDSATEGRYYEKYRDMEKAGEIQNLRLQVPYELIPAIWEEYDEMVHLKTKDKVVHRRRLKQRAVTYIADFVFDQNGNTVVVDVKGKKTKEYVLKKKMMLALKGIEITEVYYSGLKPKRTTRKRNLSLVCLLADAGMPIPGFPYYKIYPDGRVISLRFNKKKEMTQIIINGYHYITLINGTIHKRFAIHRLVAQSFISNPEHKLYVDHIDGSKDNNNVDNLRWVTAKENANNPITLKRKNENIVGHYSMLGKTGNKHPNSKAVERIDVNGNVVQYACVEETKKAGFSKGEVSKCCRGFLPIYKGYIWRFAGTTNKDSIDLKKEISKIDWPVWKKDVDGTITYYEHVSIAIKEGYKKRYIYQCCKNAHKKHKRGYIHWSFSPFTT